MFAEGRPGRAAARASTSCWRTPRRWRRRRQTGFLTLNFDWLYWPLFAMNGVDLLTPDLKQPAFNTPKAVEVIDKLAQGDRRHGDQQDLLDRPLGRAERARSPPAMSACCTPIPPAYFFLKGQGSWVDPDTLGVARAARQLVDADQPRLRHLQGLEEPRPGLGLRRVHHRATSRRSSSPTIGRC